MLFGLIESDAEEKIRHLDIFKNNKVQLDFIEQHFGINEVIDSQISSPYMTAQQSQDTIYLTIANPLGNNIFNNWFGHARKNKNGEFSFPIDELYEYTVLAKDIKEKSQVYIKRFPNMKFIQMFREDNTMNYHELKLRGFAS